MAISWLGAASTNVFTNVWSVLLVRRLEVGVVIYLSPLKSLRPEFGSNVVDPGLRVQANRAVRVDPLVRNDLVRTICAQEPAFMMLSYEGHYCP